MGLPLPISRLLYTTCLLMWALSRALGATCAFLKQTHGLKRVSSQQILLVPWRSNPTSVSLKEPLSASGSLQEGGRGREGGKVFGHFIIQNLRQIPQTEVRITLILHQWVLLFLRINLFLWKAWLYSQGRPCHISASVTSSSGSTASLHCIYLWFWTVCKPKSSNTQIQSYFQEGWLLLFFTMTK